MFVPSVSYHGQNIRSYAFAAAATVLAIWALHRAAEEPSGPAAGRCGGRRAARLRPVFALLVLAAHLLAVTLYDRSLLRRMCRAWPSGAFPGRSGS